MPIKIELSDITEALAPVSGDKALILSGANARLLDLSLLPASGVGVTRFLDELGNEYTMSVVTIDGSTKVFSGPIPAA